MWLKTVNYELDFSYLVVVPMIMVMKTYYYISEVFMAFFKQKLTIFIYNCKPTIKALFKIIIYWLLGLDISTHTFLLLKINL